MLKRPGYEASTCTPPLQYKKSTDRLNHECQEKLDENFNATDRASFKGQIRVIKHVF